VILEAGPLLSDWSDHDAGRLNTGIEEMKPQDKAQADTSQSMCEEMNPKSTNCRFPGHSSRHFRHPGCRCQFEANSAPTWVSDATTNIASPNLRIPVTWIRKSTEPEATQSLPKT
jgi:hypothetical protein